MGRKVRLIVIMDLDDTPGTMHTPESAETIVRNVLYQRMPHYNPRVVAVTPEPPTVTDESRVVSE